MQPDSVPGPQPRHRARPSQSTRAADAADMADMADATDAAGAGGGAASRAGVGAARAARSAQNAWSGVLFGVGVVAFIDETVFHQLLHWHHFYDRGTSELGLVSDGLFHALSWFATIAGLFLLADLRRRHALHPARWVGGVLVGAGAFQLYDGTVQHKLFGLHEIRYEVDLLPYDLTWNIIAAALLATGIVLLVRTRRSKLLVAAAGPTASPASPAAGPTTGSAAGPDS